MPHSVRLFLLLILFLGSIPGCKSMPAAKAPKGVATMQLKLQSLTTDKRYTYFELKPDGTLSFGGGFSAINKEAQPVMKLTVKQMTTLQNLITHSNLLTAKVSGPQRRKDSKRFHYELFLRLNGKQNSLTVNDDAVPALTKLHDQLFRFQARARYNLPGIGD